jgi:predicted MFS family arabinose efflux permease
VFYGWVVVGAGAVIVSMGLGAMFALAVFVKPIEDTMGWSRTGISTIALLNWIAMGLGSFLWGILSDRVGTRVVVLAGGSLLSAWAWCSRARSGPCGSSTPRSASRWAWGPARSTRR